MSLPRLLLLVALGGLLGAVLVWGALALVYGPEVALVLRVLFSAAVAGVVALGAADPNAGTLEGVPGEQGPGVVTFRGFDRHGAAAEVRARMAEAYQPLLDEAAARFAPGLPAPRLVFEDPDCEAAERWAAKALGLRWEDITARIVEAFEDAGSAACDFGLTSGMLAGDPFAGGRRKRSGQWGWRARMLRARRLDRAEQRREREWSVRAWGRQQNVLGGRKGRRAIERLLCLEGEARSFGLDPLPGEFTAALRARVEQARTAALESARRAYAADLGAT